MLFNAAIASAILACASYAAPTSNPPAADPSKTGPPPAKDTLLTQKLFNADTAVDRFKLLPTNEDFVFNFAANPSNTGKGGSLTAANRKTFPALVGTGSGMAVGVLGPCGFNTPHVHPRATELQIVIDGEVITEMVPENGVMDPQNDKKRRVIRNRLGKFAMQPFYQGSVHTQFNPSCTANASFIASFNAEDFGAGQVADELAAFSDDIVLAAFGNAIEGKDLEKFRKAIPVSIAKGVEECLKTCPDYKPGNPDEGTVSTLPVDPKASTTETVPAQTTTASSTGTPASVTQTKAEPSAAMPTAGAGY